MANPYLGAVNRKLQYARLLLAEQERASQKMVREALAESALYQIQSAYRYHLQGLAENYQCQGVADIVDAQTLQHTLAMTGKTSGEAQEMLDLETSPRDWLARLLAAHRSLSEVEEPVTPSDNRLIASHQLREERAFTAADLLEWTAALDEMVERHRDLMYEC